MKRYLPVLLLVAGAAAAQTPAEQATRSLNQDLAKDRARDAARDARNDPRPEIPGVQQFEPERQTLRPDVGRPEQSEAPAAVGGQRGTTSMGPNPQR